TIKDGNGMPTEQEFTLFGELKQVRRPLQIEFNFGYDKNRNGVSTTDRMGEGNHATYNDGTQRITGMTFRDCSTTSFDAPDKRNRPKTISFASGAGTITAAYDRLGRVVTHDV